MMKNLQKVCCLLLTVVIFYGCKKENHHPTTPPKTPDVYVSANIYSSLRYLPVYWKNGTKNNLSDVPSYFFTTGIAVSDTNVYLSGNESFAVDPTDPGSVTTFANYWKSGKGIPLPGVNAVRGAVTSAIAASGNHVFVAGYVIDSNFENEAAYWKDGALIKIGDPLSSATGIALSGNDVYMCGTAYGGESSGSVYWKNGVLVELYGSGANGIAVSGNNVYVSGDDKGKPVYWKNGDEIILSYNGTSAATSGIAVLGNDVYVCGVIRNAQNHKVAVYWKNGTLVPLTDGSADASAAAITTSGNDVYIAGIADNGTVKGIPTYWKNGTATILPGADNTIVTGIIVQ